MIVANPIDASLSPIRFVGTAGPSEPVRRHAVTVVPSEPSYRTQRGHLMTFAGIALAAAVAGFGTGYVASASVTDAPAAKVVSVDPVAGEFRLAPGNAAPLGIAVPLVSGSGIDVAPKPGEFRLAPGNAQPLGVAVPLG